MTKVIRPTPLEIASCLVFGEAPDPVELPKVAPGFDPLEALERALIPALERSPCVVAFSGGRDSSAVLAVAIRTAEKHGLPPPIAATYVHPGFPDSYETQWQELVIRHLKVKEWVHIEITDELDVLGDLAVPILLKYGVLWPGGHYSHIPFLRLAKGGSIVSGHDGDGLFGGWRWSSLMDAVTARRRPELRDVFRAGLGGSPKRLRALIARRLNTPPECSWLTSSAQEALTNAWAEEIAGQPVPWNRRVHWWSRRRYLAMIVSEAKLIAELEGGDFFLPFVDPFFLAAAAQRGGVTGFGDRTAVMRALFSEVLPDAVLARSSKADFTDVYWGPRSREAVRNWEGGFADASIVDEDALKKKWREPLTDSGTSLLIQQVWLASMSTKGGERFDDLGGTTPVPGTPQEESRQRNDFDAPPMIA